MNIIFRILNYLLQQLFDFTGDWGAAIILLTVIVRIMLMPLAFKQKFSLMRQQILSIKIAEIKEKYMNDKTKMENEIKKYYEESKKSMLGCFTILFQVPIISSLYFVIIRMPVEVGTMIVPWVSNIKMPDHLLILPVIYTIVSLSPNLLYYIEYLRIINQPQTTRTNLILIGTFSLLITIKAPIAIGLYFITSGIFSFAEELIFRFYYKYRCLNLLN